LRRRHSSNHKRAAVAVPERNTAPPATPPAIAPVLFEEDAADDLEAGVAVTVDEELEVEGRIEDFTPGEEHSLML